MITVTDYISQPMRFDWDKSFDCDYGTGPYTGVIHGICNKPNFRTINCSLEDRGKHWNMTSVWTFSKAGMVNERIMLSEDLVTKKYYERLKEDSV